MDLPSNPLRRAAVIACFVITSAVAYYFSAGMHREWWPAWIAALPLLLLAPRLSAAQAFACALAARMLPAAFSFWHYIREIVLFPFWLAVVTLLIPSLACAFAVLLYRELLRRHRPGFAAVAFPLTIVSAEYLFSLSQGTFFSTGYTQLANLPVLQVAAVAGLSGVSFAVNLFPAGATAIVDAPAKSRKPLVIALVSFYAVVFCWGIARLHNTPQNSETVMVGLVETHTGQNTIPSDPAKTSVMFKAYAAQIDSLAAQGAQFVVLPEMTAIVPAAELAKIDALFSETARRAHVEVMLGILHIADHAAFNEARLYSPNGQLETTYRKHHLVPTWENRSTPGTSLSVLSRPGDPIALQICRDMDYPDLSRQYAKRNAGLMLVPAWDQGLDVDAAWHGHLSIARAVEGGFATARNSKNGLLTVNDNRGRILAEQATRADGAFVTLLARVPVHHDATLYELWGDWFAWVSLVALLLMLVSLVATRESNSATAPSAHRAPHLPVAG